MFGIKFKKRDKKPAPCQEENQSEELAGFLPEPYGETLTEDNALDGFTGGDNLPDVAVTNGGKGSGKSAEKRDFARLADILCKDEAEILDECKLFQIRNIMSKLDRAVVRYGVSDKEMTKLIAAARVSGLHALAVAPTYLNSVASCVGKDDGDTRVCAIVDFPFGEASFNVKFSEIKNSVKKGVDEVVTVFPAALFTAEKAGELKKQIKKIGKVKHALTGIAVSAADVGEEGIKRFLKIVERAGIDYAVFLFGSVTAAELDAKMREIAKHKGTKPVKIMANVKNAEGVKTLIRLGADGILTPFADKIAKELFKEFKIKSAKIV